MTQKKYCEVNKCFRCGKDHGVIEVQPLLNPVSELVAFWMCPETQQPVLFKRTKELNPIHARVDFKSTQGLSA